MCGIEIRRTYLKRNKLFEGKAEMQTIISVINECCKLIEIHCLMYVYLHWSTTSGKDSHESDAFYAKKSACEICLIRVIIRRIYLSVEKYLDRLST